MVDSNNCDEGPDCRRAFLNKKCSNDEMLCVQTRKDSLDLVLRIRNVDRKLCARDGHTTKADDWCKKKYGMAYWLRDVLGQKGSIQP